MTPEEKKQQSIDRLAKLWSEFCEEYYCANFMEVTDVRLLDFSNWLIERATRLHHRW